MRGTAPRFLSVLAAAAVGLVTLTAAPTAALAQDDSPVAGAWVLESITSSDGTEQMRHPGLFVYTGTHYSTMFVIGDEGRSDMAAEVASGESDATDAEKVAAYDSFIANSGRYEIDGDQLTTYAYVAKFPNYMHDFPDNAVTFTFAVDGDSLTLTTQNGAVFSLRRVEGMPFPERE